MEAFANLCNAVQIFVCAKFKSTLTVPLVVIGFVPPSVSVEFGVATVIDVTVPTPLPTHVPFTEKHPFARLMPFANVDVAEVPVRLRYVVVKPLARVDVALLKIVVVAVPF